MRGNIEVSFNGSYKPCLAGWMQLTGVGVGTLGEMTGLSSRTITTAVAGNGVSRGTAALIGVVTGIPGPIVHGGALSQAWGFEFRGTSEQDVVVTRVYAVTPPAAEVSP